MGNLRSAVIGCGGAGTNHARGHTAAEGVDLVAVCDLDGEKARTVAEEFGVKAYQQVARMLEAEDLDVVSVATSERFHAGPAVECLEAGCHVLSEKVMAHTMEDGGRMLSAAERSGRRLGVSYNYRHIPASVFMRERVAEGAIGDPVLFTAQTHAFCWHHALDLMCYFMGYPVEVQASLADDPGKHPPLWPDYTDLLYVPGGTVSAVFRFASGALGNISSTIDVPVGEHLIDFAVCGTKSRLALHHITVGNTNGLATASPWAQEVEGLPKRTLDESIAFSANLFLDAMRRGDPPPTDGRHGLRIMELEKAALESARTARAVKTGE